MNPLEFFTATFCRRDERELQARRIDYRVHRERAKGSVSKWLEGLRS
jgi:hypothetical protein